jgi:hypothetical protein
MGLNFGPGFASTFLALDTQEKEMRLKNQKLDLDSQEIAMRKADSQARVEQWKGEQIRKNAEMVLKGMEPMAETAVALADRGVKLGPEHPLAIAAMESAKTAASYFKLLPGMKEETANQLAMSAYNLVLSQQYRPAQGNDLSRKIETLEANLGRKLTPQELTQMGGAAGTATQAQSPAGKVVQDRQMFTAQYGENSPQVKAFDEATSSEVKLDDVAGARKEFTTQSKDFVVIRDAFGKVAAAAADPSAAGDLSLIFGFMKMLDPGSSVREGEFANAQNSAGIPDRVVNMYNRALRGERLNEEQRKDFSRQAQNVFKAQLKSQLQNEETYRGIAKRNKMPEADVVIDFVGPYRKASDIGKSDATPEDLEFTAKKHGITVDEVKRLLGIK